MAAVHDPRNGTQFRHRAASEVNASRYLEDVGLPRLLLQMTQYVLLHRPEREQVSGVLRRVLEDGSPSPSASDGHAAAPAPPHPGLFPSSAWGQGGSPPAGAHDDVQSLMGQLLRSLPEHHQLGHAPQSVPQVQRIVDELHQQLESVRGELHDAKEEAKRERVSARESERGRRVASSHLAILERDWEEEKNGAVQLVRRVEELEAKNADLLRKVEDAYQAARASQHQAEHFSDAREAADRRCAELEGSLVALQEQFGTQQEQAKKKIIKYKASTTALTEQVAALEAERDRLRAEAELAAEAGDGRKRAEELQQRCAELERERDTAMAEKETSLDAARSAEEKLGSAEQRLSSAEEQLSSAEQKLGSAEEQLSSAEQKLGSAEEQLSSAEQKLGSAEEQLHAERLRTADLTLSARLLEKELSSTHSELAAAKEAAARPPPELANLEEQLAAARLELAEAKAAPRPEEQPATQTPPELADVGQAVCAPTSPDVGAEMERAVEEARDEALRSATELSDAKLKLNHALGELTSLKVVAEEQKRDGALAAQKLDAAEQQLRLERERADGLGSQLAQLQSYPPGESEDAAAVKQLLERIKQLEEESSASAGRERELEAKVRDATAQLDRAREADARERESPQPELPEQPERVAISPGGSMNPYVETDGQKDVRRWVKEGDWNDAAELHGMAMAYTALEHQSDGDGGPDYCDGTLDLCLDSLDTWEVRVEVLQDAFQNIPQDMLLTAAPGSWAVLGDHETGTARDSMQAAASKVWNDITREAQEDGEKELLPEVRVSDADRAVYRFYREKDGEQYRLHCEVKSADRTDNHVVTSLRLVRSANSDLLDFGKGTAALPPITDEIGAALKALQRMANSCGLPHTYPGAGLPGAVKCARSVNQMLGLAEGHLEQQSYDAFAVAGSRGPLGHRTMDLYVISHAPQLMAGTSVTVNHVPWSFDDPDPPPNLPAGQMHGVVEQNSNAGCVQIQWDDGVCDTLVRWGRHGAFDVLPLQSVQGGWCLRYRLRFARPREALRLSSAALLNRLDGLPTGNLRRIYLRQHWLSCSAEELGSWVTKLLDYARSHPSVVDVDIAKGARPPTGVVDQQIAALTIRCADNACRERGEQLRMLDVLNACSCTARWAEPLALAVWDRSDLQLPFWDMLLHHQEQAGQCRVAIMRRRESGGPEYAKPPRGALLMLCASAWNQNTTSLAQNLREQGLDFTRERDGLNRTPLHFAAGPRDACSDLDATAEGLVALLHEADPAAVQTEVSYMRHLPLHYAAARAPTPVVRAVLQLWREASSKQDYRLCTPAALAVDRRDMRSGEGLQLLREMLEYSSDQITTMGTPNNMLLLVAAAECGASGLVDILLQHRHERDTLQQSLDAVAYTRRLLEQKGHDTEGHSAVLAKLEKALAES
eukprot:TRINITY_DN3342_c0_g1_i1.p1 TRINITY_DN3342_c0_g1~~TRINITY_DN3342_c0_g1_i1.p1  ORF type:complete len:1420 (+),score=571.46 TRINITY_DN3342_c0_g1_i1:44-4261(+)